MFAGCIFITAKILTSVLDSLCKKTKVSKIFMGGIVMSLVTSFPELISTIYGSFDNQPLFAIYNESGSNMSVIHISEPTRRLG
ncbi:MAG: hypothetical protein K2M43_03715, partial [Mycoplasmoidaceae bacterium]|nr:hypothetical protein [Mycoplasmoidaceae bacterium]